MVNKIIFKYHVRAQGEEEDHSRDDGPVADDLPDKCDVRQAEEELVTRRSTVQHFLTAKHEFVILKCQYSLNKTVS